MQSYQKINYQSQNRTGGFKVKAGDIKHMLNLFEKGEITYSQFQDYVATRPDVERTNIPAYVQKLLNDNKKSPVKMVYE